VKTLLAAVPKITEDPKIPRQPTDSPAHAPQAGTLPIPAQTLEDKEKLIRGRGHYRGDWEYAVECELSYIQYMDGTNTYHNAPTNYHYNVSSGAGITLSGEFHKGEHFSIVSGWTVQYIKTRKYDFELLSDEEDPSYDGTIEKGLQIRVQLPLWFRWTYGKKVTGFFQTGLGIGGDFYQGRGSIVETSPGAGVPVSQPFTPTSGWQSTDAGLVNLLPIGGGIRKEISPGLEFIAFIEIAAGNMQLNSLHTYQPHGQLYAGFNFNPQRRHESKE
jgi:hypothetical protein